VENFERIEVTLQDGREILATVVGTDPRIDLALLKIDVGNEQLPSLPLGDSDQLRVGQWVIAIGNPLEFEHTVTVGVLSAKQRRVAIGETDAGVVSFLQTDAAINFGNSGGPLLDAQGNVVGINTAIRRENLAEGIGFALPINNARNVMEQLREHGHVKRGWIGISMTSQGIDDAAREYYGLEDTNGVIIESVTRGGPAAEAGLERFDIIRKVDGQPVRDNLDLISKIASRQPGDGVRLDILRDGRSRTIRVTLGDRDEGLADREISSRSDREEPEGAESTGLGFTVEPLTPMLRNRMELGDDVAGVLVTDVEFESEAADKGITPWSIVNAINDRPVRDLGDWREALDRLEPGDVVKVSGLDPRANPFSVYLRVPASAP
jgi:serine protease Do